MASLKERVQLNIVVTQEFIHLNKKILKLTAHTFISVVALDLHSRTG